jgi:hypothetical protein
MAYSIESTTAQRCTSNLNGQRCGLAEHHLGDHVAPDGRQRWPLTATTPEIMVGPTDVYRAPLADAKVTADNVSESAVVLLSQRMDRISAAMIDRVNDANRRSEGARVRAVEASEAAERVGEALAREVKARVALSAELVTTRSRRLSPLEDRVAKLELAELVSEPAPGAFQRCDVSVPKQCVLQGGHGGNFHVSNSGTMWPAGGRRMPMPTASPMLEAVLSRAFPSADVRVEDYQPAPDLSEVRLAQPDEEPCMRVGENDEGDVFCARQLGHTGPHMDATAVAHEGNAGEVWE